MILERCRTCQRKLYFIVALTAIKSEQNPLFRRQSRDIRFTKL